MTRDQHLVFCKRCAKREFDPQQGVICSLTKKIADFEGVCPTFQLDETVKEEPTPVSTEPIPGYAVVGDLSAQVKDKLRVQQDLLYAVVGGLSAAVVGAVIWAAITVSTKYQIGYMAIGVGLLVGFSVRYFGAGIDYIFGGVGAFFALVGCALGNLLSQVAFIAQAESMSYFDVITVLNVDLILQIFQESFAPMDVLFYGIAAYEGYKFAFRAIPEELVKAVSVGKVPPIPFANLRLPIVIVLFVGLSALVYSIGKGAVGVRTYYYDSGEKHYEGTIEFGKENGAWTYWWENGKIQQTGFFKEGKLDSLWTLYDENGVKTREVRYQNGLQHGLCEHFYSNGKVSGRGPYKWNRQHGAWTFFYEDGSVSEKGSFNLDRPDGTWESFYANGKLGSKGNYNKGDLAGIWNYWNEDGSASRELEFKTGGYSRVLNAWDVNGKQLVANGEGNLISYHPSGTVSEKGKVTRGDRVGKWQQFYANGKIQEEGEYRAGKYFLLASWAPDGKPQVVNGKGVYETVSEEDGSVQESGAVEGGLREGEWKAFAPDGVVMQIVHYSKGEYDGEQISYFDGDKVNVKGSFRKNQREGVWTWYHDNGQTESSVSFVNGLKEGEQIFYDSDGVVIKTEVYRAGELIEVR